MAVLFNPEVQSLQQFLHTWPPSITANPRVSWIYVRNAAAASEEVKGDLEGLAAAWSSLCLSRDDAVASADLDALALEYNVLCGKWLIFSTSSSVDMDWSKVAEGVVSGLLGAAAKVAPQTPGVHNHVTCVYTKNYLDMDDVKRVREGLRQLGFTKKLQYKPDVFTYCGVYAKNRWGIPPTRYSEWTLVGLIKARHAIAQLSGPVLVSFAVTVVATAPNLAHQSSRLRRHETSKYGAA